MRILPSIAGILASLVTMADVAAASTLSTFRSEAHLSTTLISAEFLQTGTSAVDSMVSGAWADENDSFLSVYGDVQIDRSSLSPFPSPFQSYSAAGKGRIFEEDLFSEAGYSFGAYILPAYWYKSDCTTVGNCDELDSVVLTLGYNVFARSEYNIIRPRRVSFSRAGAVARLRYSTSFYDGARGVDRTLNLSVEASTALYWLNGVRGSAFQQEESSGSVQIILRPGEAVLIDNFYWVEGVASFQEPIPSVPISSSSVGLLLGLLSLSVVRVWRTRMNPGTDVP